MNGRLPGFRTLCCSSAPLRYIQLSRPVCGRCAGPDDQVHAEPRASVHLRASLCLRAAEEKHLQGAPAAQKQPQDREPGPAGAHVPAHVAGLDRNHTLALIHCAKHKQFHNPKSDISNISTKYNCDLKVFPFEDKLTSRNSRKVYRKVYRKIYEHYVCIFCLCLFACKTVCCVLLCPITTLDLHLT